LKLIRASEKKPIEVPLSKNSKWTPPEQITSPDAHWRIMQEIMRCSEDDQPQDCKKKKPEGVIISSITKTWKIASNQRQTEASTSIHCKKVSKRKVSKQWKPKNTPKSLQKKTKNTRRLNTRLDRKVIQRKSIPCRAKVRLNRQHSPQPCKKKAISTPAHKRRE